MPILVLDTNILVDCPRLDSPEWASIVSNRSAWDLKMLIPDVVFMETVNVVQRNWAGIKGEVNKLKVGILGLNAEQDALAASIQAQIDDYENVLKSRLDEIGATVVSAPPIDHLEISRRASLSIPPYASKSKDGYRDTVIWFTLLAEAEKAAGEAVWFVSENFTDFGPKPGSWTGLEQGNRDDCPILFHNVLVQELRDRDLLANVHYVIGLKPIEQHLAAQHAPITSDDLRALSAGIDYVQLARLLAEQTEGMLVDPQQAALSLNLVTAKVQQIRSDDSTWTFTEAAHRGTGSWTAKFSVDVEVDMVTIFVETTGVETKKLRVTGGVEFIQSATVESITVANLAALPGDSQRALWDMPGVSWPSSINPEMLARFSALANPVSPETMARFSALANPVSPETMARFSALANPVSPETMARFSALANPVSPETMARFSALANPVSPETLALMRRFVQTSKGSTKDIESEPESDDPLDENQPSDPKE